MTQLGQLKGLHHNSPLRFLGYFAVLESLLTHAPKPSDPYDSITRQVKKKLALLDHRFSKRKHYVPLGKAPIDTIWAKMYHYRSLVAHGGDPEFAGDLSLLKSQGTALALIKETVKAVIRHALSEPQLLIDLRGVLGCAELLRMTSLQWFLIYRRFELRKTLHRELFAI